MIVLKFRVEDLPRGGRKKGDSSLNHNTTTLLFTVRICALLYSTPTYSLRMRIKDPVQK